MKRLLLALLLLTPWAVGAATFLEDTFDVSSDTALESWTPDTTGSAWGSSADNTGFDITSADDRLNCTDCGQLNAVSPSTPGSADYYCEAIGQTGAAGNSDRFGVVVRSGDDTFDVTGATQYHMRVRGTGVLQMVRFDAGVFNELGTYAIPTFSATSDYRIRLDVSGTGASVALDGWIDDGAGGALTLEIDVDDASANRITTTGLGGLYMRETSSSVTSVICADDTGAGPTGHPWFYVE